MLLDPEADLRSKPPSFRGVWHYPPLAVLIGACRMWSRLPTLEPRRDVRAVIDASQALDISDL